VNDDPIIAHRTQCHLQSILVSATVAVSTTTTATEITSTTILRGTGGVRFTITRHDIIIITHHHSGVTTAGALTTIEHTILSYTTEERFQTTLAL